MEKLTKSLSLFKERNCSVSIVLDSRTRRRNACEFPLSLRFTIDRKCFYLTQTFVMQLNARVRTTDFKKSGKTPLFPNTKKC